MLKRAILYLYCNISIFLEYSQHKSDDFLIHVTGRWDIFYSTCYFNLDRYYCSGKPDRRVSFVRSELVVLIEFRVYYSCFLSFYYLHCDYFSSLRSLNNYYFMLYIYLLEIESLSMFYLLKLS